jgi:hypothetical protein
VAQGKLRALRIRVRDVSVASCLILLLICLVVGILALLQMIDIVGGQGI